MTYINNTNLHVYYIKQETILKKNDTKTIVLLIWYPYLIQGIKIWDKPQISIIIPSSNTNYGIANERLFNPLKFI